MDDQGRLQDTESHAEAIERHCIHVQQSSLNSGTALGLSGIYCDMMPSSTRAALIGRARFLKRPQNTYRIHPMNDVGQVGLDIGIKTL